MFVGQIIAAEKGHVATEVEGRARWQLRLEAASVHVEWKASGSTALVRGVHSDYFCIFME